MGLRPAITASYTITTTPTNITSQGYYYHHMTLYFTSTIGASDRYEIIVLKYDPVAGVYKRWDADEVNYSSAGSVADPNLQVRVWELMPSPGSGFKLTITKLAGNNGTLNSEIIQAL